MRTRATASRVCRQITPAQRRSVSLGASETRESLETVAARLAFPLVPHAALVEIFRPLRHVNGFAALRARHQRPRPDGHRDVVRTQLHWDFLPEYRKPIPP